MNEVLKELRKMPFWNLLTKEEQEVAAEKATIKTFGFHQEVIRSDKPEIGLFCILKGQVRILCQTETGRTLTLFTLHKGYIFLLAVETGKSYSSLNTGVAEGETELLILPKDVVEQFKKENIHFLEFCYSKLSERFANALTSIQHNMISSLDEKLANLLLDERQKTGSDEIHMTNEHIAEHINSSREVVSRKLKEFVQEGVIETKRCVVVIKDPERLSHRCKSCCK